MLVVSLGFIQQTGEQADIPYSRCGRIKAPYSGMKANYERSWKERLNVKIDAEGENTLSI